MRFTVEWDFKNNVGRKISVRTVASSASCGLGDSITPGDRVALILHGARGVWSAGAGDLGDPTRLLRASRPLKAPGGVPAFFAATVDAGLSAFDDKGKTIAYGGNERVLAVCPGGQRLVMTGLSVRDVNTFVQTSPRFDLPGGSSGLAIEQVLCRNRAGTDILIFAHDVGRKFGRGAVLRIQGGAILKLFTLNATTGVFDDHRGLLYYGGGAYGHELSRLDLRSGQRRVLARVNADVRSLSLSPNGRFLANASRDNPFVKERGPSPISVLDVTTRRVAHAQARPASPGAMLWRDNETVVFVPEYQGWTDIVRVYDPRLREKGRILPWLAETAWLSGDRLFGAHASKIVQADLPSGQIRNVVTLDQEASVVMAAPAGSGEIRWPIVAAAIESPPMYLGRVGIIHRFRSMWLGTSGWVFGIALVVVLTVFLLVRSARRGPPGRRDSEQPAP